MADVVRVQGSGLRVQEGASDSADIGHGFWGVFAGTGSLPLRMAVAELAERKPSGGFE